MANSKHRSPGRVEGVTKSGGGPSMKGGTSIYGMGKNSGAKMMGCGKSGSSGINLGKSDGQSEIFNRKGDVKGAAAFKNGGRA